MTVKAWIVLVFLVIVGGILVIKASEEKVAAQRSDFFKNDLSKIRTDNGKKF